MNSNLIPDPFLNLKEVLEIIPVSPSNWYAGVASGRFPPPVKIGRRSFWPQSVIANYVSLLNIDKENLLAPRNINKTLASYNSLFEEQKDD